MATPLILNNINLNAEERHTVYVEFIVRDDINVPYGVSFEIKIDKIEDSTAQNKPIAINNNQRIDKQSYVTVYPNPANNFVIFDYRLPSDGHDTRLIISNITSQIVQEIRLGAGNSQGKVKWETGNNPSGVYTYKLINNTLTLDVGKLVITK